MIEEKKIYFYNNTPNFLSSNSNSASKSAIFDVHFVMPQIGLILLLPSALDSMLFRKHLSLFFAGAGDRA